MQKISLIGAGGKMGVRLTKNLIKSDYDVSYIEISEAGKEKLKELGVDVATDYASLSSSDIVILAVPDTLLGKVSAEVVPKMKAGAMVFTLDPACALAGKLHPRADLNYFIAHPAHPSVFNWEPDPEAQKDFFGGTLAKQTVVCALFSGDENAYTHGEELAKTIYAPISKAYKITAGQMGLLEPALVETLSATCLAIVKEGLDEVIRQGVPAEAAREFLLGHLNIQLAVIFQELPGAVFSDAAIKALNYAKPILFKDDWKKIFEPDNVKTQIRQIIV